MTETVLEFSRRVPVRDLPEDGREYRFEATPEERAAIAGRLGIIAVEALEVRFTLTPEGTGALARGAFEAEVVQECVVTLEPVTGRAGGEIVQRFMPVDGARAGETEIEVDALAEDPPEPLVRGAAELGELVVEHLALALDPYPRRPGAQAELPHEEAGGAATPFAKLRGLKLSATEG
ncbi:MAG: YceD family protein [Alphaproteobacteria bacterium]